VRVAMYRFALAAGVVACVPTEPSDSLLPPVAPQAASEEVVVAIEEEEVDTDVVLDLNGDLPPSLAADDPMALLAAMTGDAPVPASTEAPVHAELEGDGEINLDVVINEAPAVAPMPAPASAALPPSARAAGAAWGIRLVATLAQTQPPRAVLGFGNGEERVVEPGTMLPAHGLVVMAVGEDVVQLAEVRAAGDRATVHTFDVQAHYGWNGRPTR